MLLQIKDYKRNYNMKVILALIELCVILRLHKILYCLE